MTQQKETQATETENTESWPDRAARLAGIIAHYPVHNRGDLAQLREVDAEQPDTAAFWRLTNQHQLGMTPDTERRWALILKCIALLTPNGNREDRIQSAHQQRRSLGQALFLGPDEQRESPLCHEKRMEQLVSSQGKSFRSNLANIVRMLAQQGAQLDCRELARVILAEGSNREGHRRNMQRIARDYYRAEHRSSPGKE